MDYVGGLVSSCSGTTCLVRPWSDRVLDLEYDSMVSGLLVSG
jgi:hypothetical protein